MNRADRRRAARKLRSVPPLSDGEVMARFFDLVAEQVQRPEDVLVTCEDCDRSEWMTTAQVDELARRFPDGTGGCLWDVR